MTYYSRKPTRIPKFDYSCPNYYFLTICTHNRRCLFGNGKELYTLGKMVENHICNLGHHFEKVCVDKYVVMPNHIHMILVLQEGNTVQLPQIVAQFKSGVSREAGKGIPRIQVWQRSFHDHVIRDQKAYEKIWNYIECNPLSWEKDCFYMDPKYDTGL